MRVQVRVQGVMAVLTVDLKADSALLGGPAKQFVYLRRGLDRSLLAVGYGYRWGSTPVSRAAVVTAGWQSWRCPQSLSSASVQVQHRTRSSRKTVLTSHAAAVCPTFARFRVQTWVKER